MTTAKQLLAIGVLVCMSFAAALGQTTLYWTGNTDSDWNDADNWSATPGGSAASATPTSADIVVFTTGASSDCELDVNASVAEVLMDDDFTGTLDLDGNTLTVAGDFTQHAGTFQGRTAPVTIGGLLHLIGGTFHATTGTTSVADGIIEEGEYFQPHGGKLRVTGTGATIDIASFFYDLEIATGASAALNNSVQVAHNLHLDGPLDADVNGVVLGNGDPSAISGSSGVYFNIGGGPVGLFIWLIGEGTGTYTFPLLATPTGPVIPATVDIATAGTGTDGGLLLTSIELDDTKPQDLLGDGTGYYNATGGNNADMNINRMWLMILTDYTASPEFDLELNYATADLSGITATEANLKAQLYDEKHWGELLGTINTTTNTLAATALTLPTDDRTSFITLVDNTSPNRSTYGGNTGLTCADAVDLDEVDPETVYGMVDTVMWFKFEAVDSAAYFRLLSDNAINSANIYSSCTTSLLYQFLEDSLGRLEIVKDSLELDNYLLRISAEPTELLIRHRECGMLRNKIGTTDFHCSDLGCDDFKHYFPDGAYPSDGANPANGTNNNYHPIKKSG